MTTELLLNGIEGNPKHLGANLQPGDFTCVRSVKDAIAVLKAMKQAGCPIPHALNCYSFSKNEENMMLHVDLSSEVNEALNTCDYETHKIYVPGLDVTVEALRTKKAPFFFSKGGKKLVFKNDHVYTSEPVFKLEAESLSFLWSKECGLSIGKASEPASLLDLDLYEDGSAVFSRYLTVDQIVDPSTIPAFEKPEKDDDEEEFSIDISAYLS